MARYVLHGFPLSNQKFWRNGNQQGDVFDFVPVGWASCTLLGDLEDVGLDRVRKKAITWSCLKRSLVTWLSRWVAAIFPSDRCFGFQLFLWPLDDLISSDHLESWVGALTLFVCCVQSQLSCTWETLGSCPNNPDISSSFCGGTVYIFDVGRSRILLGMKMQTRVLAVWLNSVKC